MLKQTAGLLALLACLYTNGQQPVYDGFELAKNTTATALTNEGLNSILVSNYTKTSVNRIVVRPGQPPLQLLNQPVSEVDGDKTFRRTQAIPEKIALLLFKTSPIGGYFDTKSIVEVNREQSSSDFYFTETNLGTGNSTITDTIKSTTKEKILGCTNRNGSVLLITYLESTNTVIVYKKAAGRSLVKTAIEIENDGFGKLSEKIFASEVKTFADIFRKSSFAVYQNNIRYHPLFHSVRTKAYFQKDKLVFTVNSNNLSTYLISIQLDDFSYKLQRFTQQNETVTAEHSTNSLLIDSMLITAHFNKKNLLLNLFNTATETHLKTLSISSENIDSIATEPIQKTGNFWSKAETSNESFQNFQATSASNQLGLSGYIQDRKLYLMFATPFKQIVTANTLLGLAMSAAGTYYVNAAPDTYGYMLVSFPGLRSSTFISFPATLSLPGMNFTGEIGNCSVWDKLQSQMQLRKIEAEKSHFFYMNGYFYVGYMSDRKYRIFRFDERGIE